MYYSKENAARQRVALRGERNCVGGNARLAQTHTFPESRRATILNLKKCRISHAWRNAFAYFLNCYSHFVFQHVLCSGNRSGRT